MAAARPREEGKQVMQMKGRGQGGRKRVCSSGGGLPLATGGRAGRKREWRVAEKAI
jgi:hypothetical protein